MSAAAPAAKRVRNVLAYWTVFGSAALCRRLARLLRRGHPISVARWIAISEILSKLARIPDPLYPRSPMASCGDCLSIPELRSLLQGRSLGGWALEAETVCFLWRDLQAKRPHVILEFGSGLSTLIFAVYASKHLIRASSRVRVVSVEQDAQVLAETESTLDTLGLRRFVHFVFAPLDPEFRYMIRENEVLLGSRLPLADWVLIDGPFGVPGCRALVLPSVLRWLRPNARWYLHDSFRDAELRALQEWSKHPDIVVEGVIPVGKGLGTGRFEPGERAVFLG